MINAKHAGQVRAELIRNTETASRSRSTSAAPTDCDFIGAQEGSLCLLPFPDDYYTVKDEATPTGRRVDLTDAGDAAERRAARRSPPRRTTSTTASAPAR